MLGGETRPCACDGLHEPLVSSPRLGVGERVAPWREDVGGVGIHVEVMFDGR